MTRKREDKSPNRHLQQRNGNFLYKRRVPKEISALDARGEHIRISLKTDDIAIENAVTIFCALRTANFLIPRT